MTKRKNTYNRLRRFISLSLLTLCITAPLTSQAVVYTGLGLGLNTIVGDNDTFAEVDLSNADTIAIRNLNLSHDLSTALYAVLGAGRLFKISHYSGIEAFVKYDPFKTTGELQVRTNSQTSLRYQIFNNILLEPAGITYGVNWIQSILFSKAFFIYGLLGLERSRFDLTVDTHYAASGNDFGALILKKKRSRFGVDFGLGVTRMLGNAISLRAEYIYTRYENLDVVGEGNTTGAQPGDTIIVHSTVNPSHQSARLIFIYQI